MTIDIRLFGDTAVEVDGRPVDLGSLARRPRELLELLALQPDRCLARDALIESLFGHLDVDAGAANLHKAASLLRRQLGDAGAVVVEGGRVALWPAADVTVDLRRFEDAAAQGLATGDPAACREVAGGVQGDLLGASQYEAWAQAARARARRLLGELRRAAGDWHLVLEIDPTDEAAHRALMRSHARAGRRAAVVEQFQTLRRRLLADLGLPPSLATVQLYEELTRGPAVNAPTSTGVPFVGRQVEWVRARVVWERAAAGRGGGLLLCGEPGIGKTRLAEQVLEVAAADGWTTLRGAASRLAASVPYAPVLEAIEPLLGHRPDLRERLDEAAQSVLARLASAMTHDRDDEPLTYQQVASVIARLVAATAKDGGVVLLVDDIHAADADTVGLVHHLVRTATFQPVLVVTTTRTTEQDRASTASLRELVDTRRATEITLGPLARDEAVALALAASRGRGGGGDNLTGEQAAALADRAGGNPYLLIELASGGEHRATSALHARLDRLAPAARAALAAVAVAGERVTAEELHLVTSVPVDEAGAILQAAGAAGILVDDGGARRFRHALMREALVEGLGASGRARVHGSIADALLAAGAPAARIAHHLLAAGRPDEAVPHLRAAAAAARGLGAYNTARRHVEQALEVGGPEADLLAQRADVAFAMGDPAAPLLYAEALAAASPADQPSLRVRQARAHVAAYDVAAAAAALAAAEVDAPDDVARRALVEAQMAWMTGDLDRCQALVDDARTTALANGVMDVVYGAVSLRDLLFHQRGEWTEAFRHDLRHAAGSPVFASVVHDAHLCGAEAYLYGGRPYPEVKAFATQLATTAETAGATRGQAFAMTLLGEAELLSGDLGPAEHHLEEAAALHAAVGAPGGWSLSLQRLAEVHVARGERGAAATLLATALPLARANPALAWHLLGRVYGTMIRAAADPTAAVAVVDEGELSIAAGMAQACPPCSIAFAIPAAIACADAGEVERAERHVQRAEPWVAALWAHTGWRAALDEARGHIAEAGGDRVAALAALRAAAERFGAVEQPVDAARCTTALAALR